MVLYFHINKKLFSKHNLIKSPRDTWMYYLIVFTHILVFSATQVSLKKIDNKALFK